MSTSTIFTPTSHDSVEMLQHVFASLIPGGHGTNAFVAAAVGLATGVSAIFGALLLYNLIHYTVATAHEGQAMGEKAHTFWAPMRMMVAAALILPLPFTVTGANSMQLGIGWLAYEGVGLADHLNALSVKAQTLTPPKQEEGDSVDFAAGVLKAEAAQYLVEWDANGQFPDETRKALEINAITQTAPGDGYNTDYLRIGFGHDSTFGTAKILYNITATSGTLTPEQQAENGAGSVTPQAFQALKVALEPIARKVVKDVTNVNDPNPPGAKAYQEFLAAVDAFDAARAAGAAGAASTALNADAIRQEAVKDGWMSAGAWSFKLSEISRAEAALRLHPVPLVRTDWAEVHNRFFLAADGGYLNQVLNSIQRMSDKYRAAVDRGDIQTTATGNQRLHWWNPDADIASVGQALTGIGGAQGDPMTEIRNSGDRANAAAAVLSTVAITSQMIDASENANPLASVIVKGLTAVGSFIGVGESATFLKAAAAVVAQHWSFIKLLGLYGLVASTIIPLIFFIYTMFAIVAYLINVGAAIAAAPIWSVAMATEGGHEQLGQATPAIKAMLTVLFMPSLIILGLNLGQIIFHFVGQFFLAHTAAALANIHTGGSFNIFSGVDELILEIGGLLILATACAAPTTALAGEVFGMIGADGAGNAHGAEMNVQTMGASMKNTHNHIGQAGQAGGKTPAGPKAPTSLRDGPGEVAVK